MDIHPRAKEKEVRDGLRAGLADDFDGEGFLVRDLFRFLAVDVIIIMSLRLLLLIGFFHSPDGYVLAILGSKFLLAAYLVWLVGERRSAWPATGASGFGSWKGWGLSLVLYAVAHPLLVWTNRASNSLMSWLYGLVGMEYVPQVQDVVLLIFEDVVALPIRLSLVVFAVLIGPGMEELAFRGMGLDGFRRGMGTAWALFWTSLLFGLYHFSMPQLLQLSLLGFVFGAARLLSGSLWGAIAVHCLHNAIVLGLAAHHAGWNIVPIF